jgi:hypothetical protein
MRERWATEEAETRLARACYKAHKRCGCNDCKACMLNIKYIHTSSTSDRELAYRMEEIVAEYRREKCMNGLMFVPRLFAGIIMGTLLFGLLYIIFGIYVPYYFK